jgi:hypothetical protein
MKPVGRVWCAILATVDRFDPTTFSRFGNLSSPPARDAASTIRPTTAVGVDEGSAVTRTAQGVAA